MRKRSNDQQTPEANSSNASGRPPLWKCSTRELTRETRPAYSETITLLVGPEKVPLIVHKDVICERSDFFVPASSQEWNEGEDGRAIPLPAIDTETMKLYIHCAYTGKLDITIVGLPEKPRALARAQKDEAILLQLTSTYANLYIAADLLMDSFLKAHAIGELLGIIEHNGYLTVDPGLLRRVWDGTAADPALRKLLLDALVTTKTEWFYDQRSDLPCDFFFDLALRQIEVGRKYGDDNVSSMLTERREEYSDPVIAKKSVSKAS